MVIKVKAHGVSHKITCPDDITVYEFVEHCEKLAMVLGYSQEQWQNAMLENAND
jgi:hypothetical protein